MGDQVFVGWYLILLKWVFQIFLYGVKGFGCFFFNFIFPIFFLVLFWLMNVRKVVYKGIEMWV